MITDKQIKQRTKVITLNVNETAVLSHGEPRHAAVNFDTYRILQRHGTCGFPGLFEITAYYAAKYQGLFHSDKALGL